MNKLAKEYVMRTKHLPTVESVRSMREGGTWAIKYKNDDNKIYIDPGPTYHIHFGYPLTKENRITDEGHVELIKLRVAQYMYQMTATLARVSHLVQNLEYSE